MNIEAMEYFQKIAELKSISKVADISHISQPALSQQIQKLEESLGQRLLIRSNRGVELTPAGKIVLKYTENIIRTYNELLKGLEEGEKSELKIEAESTLYNYCLPCALIRMREMFPTHNYHLISKSSDQIEEDILNDICEVGFTTNIPREEALVSHNVLKEKVVLVSAKEYNFPEKIVLKEVLKHPLIILNKRCIIIENLESALNEQGYSINELEIASKLDTTEAIKTLVKKGYGAAFLPYHAIKEDSFEGKLNFSRIEDYNLDYNVYMVYKTPDLLSSEIREFIKGFKSLGTNICC